MNIILFNGPPGCGKDTAARYLIHNRYDLPGTIRFDRMSMPNKRAFAGTVGAEIDRWGNVEKWEDRKDEPSLLLGGKSYRQWQIDYSESFMKPLYGGDIFPRLFADRHSHRFEDKYYTVLVPDCGFDIEVLTLRKLLPKAGILLIRIHRTGFDFSLDSRSYITPTPEMGVAFLAVDNDRSKADFEKKIAEHIKEYFS